MYRLIDFICLISLAYSQASLIWSPPRQFLTQTVSIIQGDHPSSSKLYNNITFSSAFTQTPKVLLSLSSLQQLTTGMEITLAQKVYTQELTYFTHQLTLQCNIKKIKNLKIVYAAINLNYMDFFYPIEVIVPTSHLRTSNNPDSQYVLVKYLNSLDSSHVYEMDAMLSGFQTHSSNNPYVSVGCEPYSDQYYLVRITARNNNLKEVSITRMLIDRTLELSQASNYSYIEIYFDVVIHYEVDAPSSPDPSSINYYSSSLFYGIKSFQSEFRCLNDGSIFNQPTPSADFEITFLTFLQKSCPNLKDLYIEDSQLCYEYCSIGTYHITITNCEPCHHSCYSCSGSSEFQCTDCLQGKNRYLTNVSSCQCVEHHYVNTANNQCEPCQSLILGCISCDSPSNCLACDSSCTDSLPSCSCPANYKVCSVNEYFSSHTLDCQCDPQYFRGDNGVCQTCKKGCYKCQGSSDYCVECVDQFILISHKCLFFSKTTFLIDGNKAIYEEGQRCLIKTPDGACISQCQSSSYFYDYKCYPTACPTSTFELIDISTGEGKCQPCKSPCIQCSVTYFCDRCQPQFYYLQTGVCIHCPSGCLTCSSATRCHECSNGFILDSSNNCVQNLPSISANCTSQCSVCLISTFCQRCVAGYFLYDKTHQCISCSLPGLKLSLPPPSIASTQKECYQVCGDGYLYNQQCDDNNTVSGDGCSSSCIVQQQYSCQYLSQYNKSICFKSQYEMAIKMEKDLFKNQILITLEGIGIDLSIMPLLANCGLNSQILSAKIKNQQVTFLIQFTENLVKCSFEIDGSVYIPSQQAKVSTLPKALYVDENQPIRVFVYSYLKNSHIFLSYIFWMFCLIGISPFDIWLNYQFIALQLLMMHEKQHNPPGIYGIYEYLKYFFFNFQKDDSFENQLDASWKVLSFYLSIVMFYEIIVRLFIKIDIFPDSFQNVLKQCFKKRKYHYVCVHSIFQPISTYFCLSVFVGGHYQMMPMIISSIHLITITITLFFGYVYSNQILTIKNHRKYVLFLLLIKSVNILVAGKVYFTHSKYIINASILLASVFIFLFYVTVDKYTAQQIEDNSKSTGLQLKSSSQQSSNQSKNDSGQDEQEEKPNKCISLLTGLRKFNLLVVFFSFITNMGVLLTYESQSDDPKNFQLFSLVILLSFSIGMLTFGQILNIISHVCVFYLYRGVTKKNQESLKQPEKSEERFKNKSHISVISISKNGSQDGQYY